MELQRIAGLRGLVDTLDLLYGKFCERRVSKAWSDDVKQMRRWLQREPSKDRKPAA